MQADRQAGRQAGRQAVAHGGQARLGGRCMQAFAAAGQTQ